MRHAAALRAFRHRNFRLFFVGQGISIIGTWVQTIALSWLMYRLTGSPVLLGLTTFLTQAPILLVGPFSGLLSDRFERRKLLLIAQSLLMLQALVLGTVVLSGYGSPLVLLGLALAQGLIAATDTPVRQAFLSVMVPDRNELLNAIALNSLLMNSGRLVGPTVAGLLLAFTSEGVCFLINALSYIAVIAAVRSMRLPRVAMTEGVAGVRAGLREGLRFALESPTVRTLLPLVMLASFFASPYVTLMPVMTREVFGAGPSTLGFLVGAAGLGGLSATAWLASRRTIEGLPLASAAACVVAGLCLAGFAVSENYPLSLALMFGTGFGIIATAASTNMILQTTVADHMRGRIVGLYTMSFLGLAPFGGLWAGFSASHFGVRATLAFGGVACALGALTLRASARRLARSIREQQ